MKRPRFSLDQKYIKICSYAALTVIVTALIMYLLYNTRGVWSMAWSLFMAVLRPIVIGGIISYLLRPVVKKIEKYFVDRGLEKIARTGSVVISIALALAIVFGILGILVFTLVRTVGTISEADINSLVSYIQHDFASFTTKLEEYLGVFGLSTERISKIAGAIVNGISNVASGLLFGVIFAIYFMLDNGRISTYWMRVLRVLSDDSSRAKMKRFLADADRVFSGYIRGQFIDAAIIGVMTTVGMMIIGVPNGMVVGVLTGVGNLIPYVGPVIGYLTLALVCIPTGAWVKFVAGAVVLAILLFVDGNIINPKLLSNNVMVHPLLVVAALIGGGAVGGFVGMLIAVPTAALIKIQFDRYLDSQEKKMKAQHQGMNGAEKYGSENRVRYKAVKEPEKPGQSERKTRERAERNSRKQDQSGKNTKDRAEKNQKKSGQSEKKPTQSEKKPAQSEKNPGRSEKKAKNRAERNPKKSEQSEE